jgi:uncharacterized protein (TIGR03435 family)
MLRSFVLFSVCSLGFAQTPATLSFEVVSVKPASGLDDHRSSDNAEFDANGISMDELLWRAFQVPAGRLRAPKWVDSAAYDVHGKLPAGSTPKQVPQMILSMLRDRFALQFHVDHKMESAYELRVGDGELKLRPSPPPESLRDEGTCALGGDRHPCRLMTMERLALMLSTLADAWLRVPTPPTWAIDRPVVDATGLKGEYDFEINYGSGKRDPVDPEAKRVVDGIKELGLKLEPVKYAFEYVVIDHLERAPTAN